MWNVRIKDHREKNASKMLHRTTLRSKKWRKEGTEICTAKQQ